MAELNFFGYQYGQSFVHRLDVRCKLVSLLLLTSAIVAAIPAAMGPLSLGLVLSMGRASAAAADPGSRDPGLPGFSPAGFCYPRFIDPRRDLGVMGHTADHP